VCLPYAGGGASIFRGWQDRLPADVEVLAVELPGRESRMREVSFTRLRPLVDILGRVLEPVLDRPIALFGHSMGALIAFELARTLRRAGRSIQRLFVAGHQAPHAREVETPLHKLPDDAFKSELVRLGGTTQEVISEPELMEIFLPVLRADFALVETYVYTPEPPLSCPISAFGGLADTTVPRARLQAWQDQGDAEFRVRMFPGNHFFVHSQREALLAAIADDLAR
jgi:medium-chain acyl-[acyl-carrier-protein] hydrolase